MQIRIRLSHSSISRPCLELPMVVLLIVIILAVTVIEMVILTAITNIVSQIVLWSAGLLTAVLMVLFVKST